MNNTKRIFIVCFVCLSSFDAFALYTETIPGQCGTLPKLSATFTINQYNCAIGQYLPAHTLGCQTCPTGYTCSGGTYRYNNNAYQGAIKSANYITNNLANMCAQNIPHALRAVFTRNNYTCSAGYYLPANIDGCTICPANSICSGGTYTFNETIDQGIVSCNGQFSPSGSTVCYPHVMHIGNDNLYLKSTKLTTPSLNVKIGNDVFFANMTMSNVSMNSETTHKLKLQYNGNIYSVYDDTVSIHEE